MDFGAAGEREEGILGGYREKTAPTFIDLFAGCGGLSLGLRSAGWTGLFAVEKDQFAFRTFKANLIDGSVGPQMRWPAWIPARPLAITSFLRLLEKDRRLLAYLRNVDLLAGGPPCQGFSFAGRRQHNDPRNQLFRHYIRAVAILRPRMLLMENVRGIAVSHEKNRTSFAKKIARALTKLGYDIVGEIHRASDYGVPQERPRLIIVGIRRGVDQSRVPRIEALPAALKAAVAGMLKEKNLPSSGRVTVRQALSDLTIAGKTLEACPDAPRRQQLRYVEPDELSPYPKWLRLQAPAAMDSMRLARHSPDVAKKFATFISHCKANGRRGVTLRPEDRAGITSKKHSIVVLDPNQPSHTLTTLPDDVLHYEEPRILTVREYARLQSFPDWFVFMGKYTTGGDSRRKECPRYTQLGNAIAPFVAEAFGRALRALLYSTVISVESQSLSPGNA